MFLLTNLVSSISKITQDLGNIVSVNTTVTGSSSIEGQISTSGLLSDTLSTVTNTLTTTTTGLVSDAVGTVTGSIGSTSPVDTVTNIIGGVTGGIDLGTSPIAPVIDVVQGGIDILQGVESLKTEIINTGIDTVADTIIGVLPQTEHPVSEIADLGTLTFETSRDTVNGTLEVISDLVGGDIQGATESATGVVETLITNGTTATGIVTDVVGSITDVVGGVTGGVDGNPLEVITDIIGGVTGGVDGNPLEVITDIIGGVTGGVDGNPLEVITDIIGGITGGIGDGTSPIAPVIDVVQGGIDILQGVESLKTEIINTGIDTVADTIIGILPQTEYPVSDLADLGTLTFETSRDTVNGALEVVSDLVGGDIQGATESATGILDTLITNGTTATGIINNIIGGATSGDSPLGVVTDIIGGVTGGVSGNPLEIVTDIIGGVTGGVDGNPLEVITDIIGGVTGGVDGNPLEVVTDIIGGVTGGVDGNPLEVITDIIGGVTGGVDGNPLEVITDIIGGVTGGIGGGTSPISPVIDVVQGGIDILQGVESLKTEIINTGIDTVADTIISILPQAEHPVSELADLGTLTFETSRDTVNGTLEVISDLVGGDIQGATESATGILDTLITNGTTATGLVTEIIGGLTGTIGGVTGGDSSLGLVTDLLGGLTGSVDGDSPLGLVTDLLGGLTGGVTGGTDNPIGIVTDIVGSLTGGVTGEGGLDVISNLLGGLTGGSLLGGVTSTVSSVTNTTHTIVPTSLLTDNFLENSFNTV
ncbi:beta strand repeat-containing protein [Acinetobacter pittii]|uniref:beta strand repeat-containing protein n=1 Tax=Acinetobacter pittii TaxID=48296 RepID=UPI0032F02828